MDIQKLVIQSKDRVSTDSIYSFNVRLRNLKNVYNVHFKQLCMKNAVLPYGSSARSNILYWTRGAGASATMVAPASWTGPDLAAALQATLNSTGAGGFTVTYSSVTFKFTITNASAFTINFASAADTDTLYNVFGFDRGVNTASTTSLTSTYMAKCQGFDAIFIKSNALTRSKTLYNGATTTTQGSNTLINNAQNIFMMIPVDVDIGQTIRINENDLNVNQAAKGLVLEEIDIALVDAYGQPIVMEADWVIIFDLECSRADM